MKNLNKKPIKDLWIQLLDKAKESKNDLEQLKEVAVHFKQYELASERKELQNKLYPETEAEKKMNEKVVIIQTLFKICDIEVGKKSAYIADKVISLHNSKEGQTDIDSVAKIKADADMLFGK